MAARVQLERTRQGEIAAQLKPLWRMAVEAQDCMGRKIQVRDLVQFENSDDLTTVARVLEVRGRRIFVDPFWMMGVRRRYVARWLPNPQKTRVVPEDWV